VPDTTANPGSGVVEQINLTDETAAPCTPVARARALAGRGLEGDRKFRPQPDGQPGRDLTLIAAEALEAMAHETGVVLTPAESRRNVLTRGVDLNALVGQRFMVGGVLCEGVRLCEPCEYLESLTRPGVLKGLVHRGGLRANILRDGEIAVGDGVRQA
jgi:MOSC domain-containing protein YiiM